MGIPTKRVRIRTHTLFRLNRMRDASQRLRDDTPLDGARKSNGRPVLDDSVPEFFTAQAFDMLLLHGHRTIMRDVNVSACRRPTKV